MEIGADIRASEKHAGDISRVLDKERTPMLRGYPDILENIKRHMR